MPSIERAVLKREWTRLAKDCSHPFHNHKSMKQYHDNKSWMHMLQLFRCFWDLLEIWKETNLRILAEDFACLFSGLSSVEGDCPFGTVPYLRSKEKIMFVTGVSDPNTMGVGGQGSVI